MRPPQQRAQVEAALALVVVLLAVANLLWPDAMGAWGRRAFIGAYIVFLAWDLLGMWARGTLRTPLSKLPALAREEGVRPLSTVAALFGAVALILLTT